MNRKTRATARLTAAAALAIAVALAPLSHAGARGGFVTAQATAATSPCKISGVPVPGGWQGGVIDINDAGVLVGSATDADGVEHPTYWTPDGPQSDGGFTRHSPELPAAGELLDINSAGVAVGFDDVTYQTYVLNTVTGAFRYLPDLAGGQSGRARRINNAGVIAGAASDANGTWLATTWAPPYDTAHQVGVPGEQQLVTWTDPGDGQVYTWVAGSEADGINDAGTVAAFATIPDPHAMRAHGHSPFSRNAGDDQPIDESLDPAVPLTKTATGRINVLHTAGDQAYAFALDDSGIIVGDDVTSLDTYDTRPVYWTGSAERDLGLPADAAGGRALNIDGAWVTGFLYYPDLPPASYIWTGGGLLQLLQGLPGFGGGTLAHGVNRLRREVGGLAFREDGSHVPVMWRCPSHFTTAG